MFLRFLRFLRFLGFSGFSGFYGCYLGVLGTCGVFSSVFVGACVRSASVQIDRRSTRRLPP